ncbi:MAG: P-type DNA transfer protein VirB5 [Cellvibrionaceae bacterium]
MKIKKIIATLFFVFTINISSNANAGIPVIDVASLVQSVMNIFAWVQQANDMYQQIQSAAQEIQMMQQQAQQMQDDFNSMTGSRLLGMILNDPNLQDYIPVDMSTVYNDVYNSGYGGLTPGAKTIRDSSMIYNCNGESSDFRGICETSLNLNAQTMAMTEEAFDTAVQRGSQIESLMQEINNTTDPKEIAELNSRINAENVMIANEQNKVQLWQSMAQAQAKASDQQAAEWYINSGDRPSVVQGFRPTP